MASRLQSARGSPRSAKWYDETLAAFIAETGLDSIAAVDGNLLRGFVIAMQERGLAAYTVKGRFVAVRTFVRWAASEGYEVEASALAVRAPKVPQLEVRTYSGAELDACLSAASRPWHRMALLILAGTGMRVAELCALDVEDFEDADEMAFLKVRRGKGAKFRRAPVSERLRRDLVRYISRDRLPAEHSALLVRDDAERVTLNAAKQLFRRVGVRAGVALSAHRIRHTFATEYLRNGGDIERLRKILGHTTYEMVMRYVHLRKEDLYEGFNERALY